MGWLKYKNFNILRSWEPNKTFLRNKQFLNVCLRWYILKSYHLPAEITFKNYWTLSKCLTWSQQNVWYRVSKRQKWWNLEITNVAPKSWRINHNRLTSWSGDIVKFIHIVTFPIFSTKNTKHYTLLNAVSFSKKYAVHLL